METEGRCLDKELPLLGIELCDSEDTQSRRSYELHHIDKAVDRWHADGLRPGWLLLVAQYQ